MTAAVVEVHCGTNHSSIYIPNQGWKCRYARGFVGIEDTKLISRSHECHLCSCYWCLPASTPPEKQICENCGGPAIATGDDGIFPGTLMKTNFVDPAEWNQECNEIEIKI